MTKEKTARWVWIPVYDDWTDGPIPAYKEDPEK